MDWSIFPGNKVPSVNKFKNYCKDVSNVHLKHQIPTKTKGAAEQNIRQDYEFFDEKRCETICFANECNILKLKRLCSDVLFVICTRYHGTLKFNDSGRGYCAHNAGRG